MNITMDFSDFGLQEFQHYDDDPFKGWLNLAVTNTGTEAWGDFHFQIFQVPGSGAVDNVDFIVNAPYQPISGQTPLSWNLSQDGSTLDLFFYGDPVLPNEQATFSVYTDNTADKVSFFGVQVWPTPVPIPGAVWLLGSGLVSLAALKRRFS
ncbi:MAG: VPLPA-CTERM sorting domain-containing protein [Deltaproteobacteria bacterium]|nr:VPLPA-CTERM sorting domain-containing protein [Deltaproteobacteria bacterium]